MKQHLDFLEVVSSDFRDPKNRFRVRKRIIFLLRRGMCTQRKSETNETEFVFTQDALRVMITLLSVQGSQQSWEEQGKIGNTYECKMISSSYF